MEWDSAFLAPILWSGTSRLRSHAETFSGDVLNKVDIYDHKNHSFPIIECCMYKLREGTVKLAAPTVLHAIATIVR